MDIALHDSFFDIYLLQSSLITVSVKKEEINNYIEPFFVGLLEGEGTITTNLRKSKKSIAVRIIIALKNDNDNEIMLNKIQEVIGGRVVIERNDKYVTWIASSNRDINKVFLVLARYPLLTVRKQCQLEFAKKCLLNQDVDNFMLNRENMYKNSKALLAELNQSDDIKQPSYFKPWLSGFIEAEGNFILVFDALRSGHLRKSAFTIGQNDELHILKMIKLYFQGTTKILKDIKKINFKGVIADTNHYRLHLYNASTRKLLFEHFDQYPLIGQKKVSYSKFYEYHIKKVNKN